MRSKFEKHELEFEDEFFDKAMEFMELLLAYSKTHNITALKDKNSIAENILDSVYILKFIKFKNLQICDIGSGAGFPAIFLAMCLKDCKFDLFEPIAKKSSFLHLVKVKLKLDNICIKTQRIENQKDKKYDLVTSRAVSDTKILLKLCKNISLQNTQYLFYKGSSVLEELKGLKNYKLWNRADRNYLLLLGDI